VTATPAIKHVPGVRMAWREPAGLRRHGVAESEAWMAQAVCKEVDPELFFVSDHDTLGVRRAKNVCATCPVRAECAGYAIQRVELQGIWGGLTTRERWKHRQ
jgi:WhiB family redox-sensing transcriptional regulator